MTELKTAETLHVQAQHALLDGLRREDDLSQLERAVRQPRPRPSDRLYRHIERHLLDLVADGGQCRIDGSPWGS